jgi:uncharacterized caspase-like protein
MLGIWKLRRWLVAVFWCAAVLAALASTTAAEADPTARGQVKIMFMVKEVGEEGIQAAEIALVRAFISHGYSVLNRDIVAQTLRREAYLVQRYETEAAKRLGSFLGADVVVSGRSKVRVLEEDSSLVGRFIVSQADVGAKAILVRSGKEIVAESAQAKKPFDATGQTALRMASEALAAKLIKGIDESMTRPVIDYRLAPPEPSRPRLLMMQSVLRKMPGVQQVKILKTEQLAVSVEKKQDEDFKKNILQPLKVGSGSLEVVAREGETIHLGSTEPRATPTPPVGQSYKPGYRKSWAVVIGINDYQHWPKLQYAVNDARAMEKLLKRLGFDEVITILDAEATQRRLLRVLGDELKATTDKEDRVFIFYAGHGQTEDLPNDGKMGYIIPVDGELKNYYSTAISMGQLQDLSKRIPAKHIFYAWDSCFSGLLLKRFRGDAPRDPTTVETRQVLTAGDQGEQVVEVSGHGLFTKVLLEGLEGGADRDKDGIIKATELSQFVIARVLAESRNRQNPNFGNLEGGGEVIFGLNR